MRDAWEPDEPAGWGLDPALGRGDRIACYRLVAGSRLTKSTPGAARSPRPASEVGSQIAHGPKSRLQNMPRPNVQWEVEQERPSAAFAQPFTSACRAVATL